MSKKEAFERTVHCNTHCCNSIRDTRRRDHTLLKRWSENPSLWQAPNRWCVSLNMPSVVLTSHSEYCHFQKICVPVVWNSKGWSQQHCLSGHGTKGMYSHYCIVSLMRVSYASTFLGKLRYSLFVSWSWHSKSIAMCCCSQMPPTIYPGAHSSISRLMRVHIMIFSNIAGKINRGGLMTVETSVVLINILENGK